MTALLFRTDTQGRNAYAPSDSSDKYSVLLASTGNATFTVPDLGSGEIIAAMAYPEGGAIWSAINGTASVPNSGTPSSTNSFPNRAQVHVKAGDTINFYNNSSTNQTIAVSYYLGS